MINDEKAKILVETLPYIEKYSGQTMVVKYGGAAMQNDKLKDSVMEDIILMSYVGINVVLVHGGGKEINKLLDKLNIKKELIHLWFMLLEFWGEYCIRMCSMCICSNVFAHI